MSESPPFMVVKFLSTDDEETDDECYEVALSKWLEDLDENRIGNIFWPEDKSIAGTLVRTQANAESNWPTYTVEVKRYYDTYFQARKGLTGIIEYASAYETDTGKEMGRGKRKKKVKPFTSSEESDNDQCVKDQLKEKKCSIPSPPTIHVPGTSISTDKNSGHIKYKRHIIEDSSSIKKLKVAKDSSESTGSENTRERLLEKIINERKKAMKKNEKNNTTLFAAHSQVLQPSSGKQSTSNTFLCQRNMKTSSTSKIVKSPEKTAVNKLRELFDNTKTKTKEKVKKSKPSTASEVSLKITPGPSNNYSERSNMSPSTESDISRKSDDPLRNPQKSPSLLNLELKREHNPINSLSQSPSVNDDTSQDTTLLAQEEKSSPLSSKEKLERPVRNLTNVLSADFDQHFITLKKNLDDMSSKLDVIIMNQANLNKCLIPEQAIITRPSNLPPLPLNDMKNLEEFDKFLSKDVNLSAACYYLKSLPLGDNEKIVASRLMTKLMTNSLAKQFNFDGHNPQKAKVNKRPFKKLKLWELFQGVMLLKFPTSDLEDALNAVRNWLRNAAGRKQ
ncbi:uncharacterized protein LOC114943164 isoform X2 [Nylanderia fulva]|uniref:uncharacterized protein LOC114943164 isoform X2 n=1 Tax=Nylanderia fulva TaxID=613905 RepID=UPI0010FB77EE|nr:uncharacterized protein LOC114943164 isoform X2 [Nylanderia fulva]